MTMTQSHGVLAPGLLAQAARLGGQVHWAAPITARQVHTPAGERAVPHWVQFLQVMYWQEPGVLKDAQGRRVDFPYLDETSAHVVSEPRAWLTIARDHDCGLYLVDLDTTDGEYPDDPVVHRVQAGDSGQPVPDGVPLSQVLASLTWSPQWLEYGRACLRGDVADIHAALERGAGTGPLDEHGITPLHLAALSRDDAAVSALLERGADPDARTGTSAHIYRTYTAAPGPRAPLHIIKAAVTPLLLAVETLRHGLSPQVPGIVKLLLDAGADPCAVQAGRHAPTPLETCDELSRLWVIRDDVGECRRLLQHAISASPQAHRARRAAARRLPEPAGSILASPGRDAYAATIYEEKGGGWRALTCRQMRAWLAAIYSDRDLVIDVGPSGEPRAVCPRPGLLAAMLEALTPVAGQLTLHVGTGSGWPAAVLAHRLGPRAVITVDEDSARRTIAEHRLAAAGYPEMRVRDTDVLHDAVGQPVDRILATAGGTHIPQVWLDHVAVGARIVAPVGAGVVCLEVTSRGRAQGHFLAAAYTPLHWHAPVPPEDIEQVAAAVRETNEVPLARVRGEDADLLLPLSLARPDVSVHATRDGGCLLRTPDGSIAQVTAGGTVQQTGPHLLWDSVRALHEQFPAPLHRTDFRIVLTRGRQVVWSPDHGPTWGLPVEPAD
ncbi:hypothetical protein ACFVUW_10530 [Streptomyces xiamenensis]|uniref:hypothetical protein n=1 Tax=Streptomyces xiamenensis TaxID=408015 RepID=UPI0036E4EDC5